MRHAKVLFYEQAKNDISLSVWQQMHNVQCMTDCAVYRFLLRIYDSDIYKQKKKRKKNLTNRNNLKIGTSKDITVIVQKKKKKMHFVYKRCKQTDQLSKCPSVLGSH